MMEMEERKEFPPHPLKGGCKVCSLWRENREAFWFIYDSLVEGRGSSWIVQKVGEKFGLKLHPGRLVRHKKRHLLPLLFEILALSRLSRELEKEMHEEQTQLGILALRSVVLRLLRRLEAGGIIDHGEFEVLARAAERLEKAELIEFQTRQLEERLRVEKEKVARQAVEFLKKQLRERPDLAQMLARELGLPEG